MKKKLFFIIFFYLLFIVNIFAQERFFIPVDIGQQVDTNSVKEEKINEIDAKNIFQINSPCITKEYLKKCNALKETWIKLKENEYKKKFENEKFFKIDVRYPISCLVSEFSKSKVRIFIVFNYGHYMWNYYYILLKNYVVKRNDFIDNIFNLKEQEKNYSFEFKKIKHGSTNAEMIEELGKDYKEYVGQTPTYRDIYYEKYDIEIVIQDQIVKYIAKGRPFWAPSPAEK